MVSREPNRYQKQLIEALEGIYLVDAGPGTGKTYTISLRYSHILENRDVEPDDILLITFTENAAQNMKERIINTCSYDRSALRDAPISTFHGLCNRILRTHGFEAPEVLGIDERITSTIQVIENEILEMQEFRNFMTIFIERHPHFRDYYASLHHGGEMLNLIRSLASRGIFPTRDGWFQDCEKELDGDYERFMDIFRQANAPVQGSRKMKQSFLRKRMNGYKNRCFSPGAPHFEDICGDTQVSEHLSINAFNEDREELKNFVHDVYFCYIEYMLGRNYINFSFMIMFAYVLLFENHTLRERIRYRYIMIDEFQDTNEIQFKLSLLLCRGNLCVVGDWKQSIFSFQYASVKNITEFEPRILKYIDELNRDHRRIDYSVDNFRQIHLMENYRSAPEIIDFSERALVAKATKDEDLDIDAVKAKITHLEAAGNKGPSEILSYSFDDQKEGILWKINDIVDNPDYIFHENGKSRLLKYCDVAVLVRKRKFGMELLSLAEKHDIPVAYEGGIELFRTPPSLLLLAWFRILKNISSARGWAVVLENAGYSLEMTGSIIDGKNYPLDMLEFHSRLSSMDTAGSIARTVFDKYSLDSTITDRIIDVLESVSGTSRMNIGQIISFMEQNIDNGTTYDVDSTRRGDVFRIQTIHSAKGLEYPVVILPDMDVSHQAGNSSIDFRDPSGLRQKKIYSSDPYPFIYDNWRYYLLSKAVDMDYDEERRLRYVAITRAQNYLFLTAGCSSQSQLFINLGTEPVVTEPEILPVQVPESDMNRLVVGGVVQPAPLKLSCHSLMNIAPSAGEGGKGMEYGTAVHSFAQRYAADKTVRPRTPDENNVKRLLDSLDGELISEIECILPIDHEGRCILFSGVIDLVHIDGDSVDIIDYKTDRSMSNHDEYVKQLSLYYHVLSGIYKDKRVQAYIYYTAEGRPVHIERPLSIDEIKGLINSLSLLNSDATSQK